MSEPTTVNLAKAILCELDANFEKKINPEREMKVQFNPESLRVSFANQVQPQGEQKGTPSHQFVGAGTTKLSVLLWFDVNAPQPQGSSERDVRKLTQKVAYFITPRNIGSQQAPKYIPPAVRFVWGSFQFDGLVDSLEENLEFFSNEGIPQRASVTLALSQQRIIFKFTEPPPTLGIGSGNAPVGTSPLAQATSGSSLQSMASASGQGDWQSIAAANGIENPRLLQPGQLIDLNASRASR